MYPQSTTPMASWSSPRGRGFHDTSPSTPLTPLSPSALPQWLLSNRPKPGVLTTGRLKTVALILGIITLGWMASAVLSPEQESIADVEAGSYGAASAGLLTDSSGYGLPLEDQPADGMIGDEKDPTGGGADLQGGQDRKRPSVAGALSELHKAVGDKLQSWNPYHARPMGPGSKANNTASADGKKPLNATIPTALSGEHVQDGIQEEDRLGARTRVGKCTILFNGNRFWEHAIQTHEQHDRLQGYRLHVLRQQLLDDVWSKPAYILSLLLREMSKPESERLEWLLWVDADTIILNPNVPIEIFLPPPGSEFEDVHLIYSNDWNGLNNGVFPVRVNVWSVQFFSAIVAYRHYKPDDQLVFRDQSAMQEVMQHPSFAKNVVEAPQRWFNAYQGEHNETLAPFQIRRGDLLVHFAGVPNREERMGYWLDRAEQHLDDWEVPVKSTSYPQEARDFWDQQREARKNKKAALEETRLKAVQLITDTEQRLSDYGDRLSDEQRSSINDEKSNLNDFIGDEKWQYDLPKAEELTRKLGEVSQPLTAAIADSNKKLLSAAHEAIFAGEKDLLDNGFAENVDNAELQRISAMVKTLKNLVMAPEDMWNKNDITTATNTVTEARAKLQDVVEAAKAIKDAKKPQVEASQDTPSNKSGSLNGDLSSKVIDGVATFTVSTVGMESSTSGPVQVTDNGPIGGFASTLKVVVSTIVPVETVVGQVVTVRWSHPNPSTTQCQLLTVWLAGHP